MKVFGLVSLTAVGLSLAVIGGCSKQQQSEVPGQKPQPSLTQGAAVETGASAVAGIHWSVPARWKEHPPRQMRIATYMIPATEGDVEGGECAVFFFGGDQGGDVQSNIARWVGQFENAGKPEQSSKEVHGLKVTTVTLSGTYLAPGGPMMQSQGKKENYRLLGAIIEAPGGSVFFKCTGPAKTMDASGREFDELIASMEKQ